MALAERPETPLERAVSMVSSVATEEQCRLLGVGPLLDELQVAVMDLRLAVTRHGVPVRRVGSACDQLDLVLRTLWNRRLRAKAWYQVPSIFFSNFLFRGAVASELRRLSRRFAGLASHVVHVLGGEGEDDTIAASRPRWYGETEELPDRPMVGRSELVDKMMGGLLGKAGASDAGEDGPLVLPIVGGPGIGKTRLAQALFNDARVRQAFDERQWVYVSPYFNPAATLERFYNPEALTNGDGDQETQIKRVLHGRRCLIVLDDVWDPEVSCKWYNLMHGDCRIVLTTRSPAVASMAATLNRSTKPYFLQPLQQEDSSLVLDYFTHYGHYRPELKEVSAMIANKCDGVPLLLNSAGRFLKEKLEKKSWEQFLQNIDKSLHDAVGLTNAYVSYQHLPHHLRECFLFCSMFPSDYNFDAEELADLLAAQGLIPVTESQKRECLQQLFDNCFQPVEQSKHGDKLTYRMHKVLHMFAQYRKRQVSSVIRDGEVTTRVQSFIRHLSLVVHPLTTSFPSYLSQLKDLRTLILLQEGNMCLSDQQCEIKDIPKEFCQSFRGLQVLNLQCSKIKKLPNNFELLTHLIYLDLSQTDMEKIPSSISKMKFLETLKLSRCEKLQNLHENTCKLFKLKKLDLEGCHSLVALPKKLSKLKSLEYLNVISCFSLTRMPDGMGQLTNLHTLLGYFVPSIDGSAMSELQWLADLNRLSLERLEKVSNLEDARTVMLCDKEKLESLLLRWDMDAENTSTTAHRVLESLQPNPYLKALEIVAYEGDKFPSWMISTEPYLISLVEIRLVNLRACEKVLPPLGLLPCLKIAEISGAENISCIDDNFYGHNGMFPSLEKLTFSYMTNLEVWEQAPRMAMFPRLAELAIIQCPKLRALRMELPSVEKLILWMNNKMLYSSKGGLRGVEKSLEHVSISFCEELLASSNCEGLQDLGGLKKLELCGCHELTCLPHGLRHLSSLRSLTVDNCSKLEILPDWLEKLAFLRVMRFSGCPVLHSIPEGLRCIDIIDEGCPNLPEPSGKSVDARPNKGKRITIEEKQVVQRRSRRPRICDVPTADHEH